MHKILYGFSVKNSKPPRGGYTEERIAEHLSDNNSKPTHADERIEGCMSENSKSSHSDERIVGRLSDNNSNPPHATERITGYLSSDNRLILLKE